MSGNSPAHAEFAQSSGVRAGEIVFAIGNPLGLQSSVTQGIVSSINRKVNEGDGVTLSNDLQTSAEINPGFGGAQAPGIGFAIPSYQVQQVADRLIGGGS